MKSEIIYSKEQDILSVCIDKLPDDMLDIITSEPFEHILEMVFNKYTGALLEFQLSGLRSELDRDAPNELAYDGDTDTLYIHLHPDDNSDGMCDMAHHDSVKGALITLNRSRVGNLTGIEINGLSALMSD